jgi:hypothetical protein
LKGITQIAQKEDPFPCNKSATNAHNQEKKKKGKTLQNGSKKKEYKPIKKKK